MIVFIHIRVAAVYIIHVHVLYMYIMMYSTDIEIYISIL